MNACLLLEGDGCLGNLCSVCTGRLDAERVARETWGTQAVRLGAELVAAESALASERAAHAETRRERDEARVCRQRAEERASRLAGDAEAISSRLAAAEECLREIAREDCTWYPAYKEHPTDEPPCPSEIARAFLAGGKP